LEFLGKVLGIFLFNSIAEEKFGYRNLK